MKTLFNNGFVQKLSQGAILLPGIAILIALVAYPLATIVLQSLMPNMFDANPSFRISLDTVRHVFMVAYTYRAILNSLWIGIAAAVISTCIGTFLAVVVKRFNLRFLRWADPVVWLIFLTPSYLISQGWIMLLQKNGILTQLLQLNSASFQWFFTPVGLMLVMGLKYFPVVYISVSNALTGLGSEYEDAARLTGARPLVAWIRINLPLLTPAMLTGAAIVFADGVGDFGLTSSIARTTHIPVVTYAIFSSLNESPVNYPQAGALSFILIALIGIAMMLQIWYLKRGSYSIIKNQIRPSRLIKAGFHRLWLYPLAICILALAYAVPMFSIGLISLMKSMGKGIQAGNFSFAHYSNVLNTSSDFFRSIVFSIRLAVGASVVSTLLGLFFAYVIEYTKIPGRKLLYALTMSTIAIPGIVLASGFVFAYNATWMVPLHLAIYGTTACMFLAYVAGTLPYAVRLHVGALAQISPSLVMAGKVQGASLLSLFRKIIFPLVASSSISAFLLAFVHTLFELPASELLYPAGSPPFPIVLMLQFESYKWEDGSALTVVAVFGALLLYLLWRAAARKWFSYSYYSTSDNKPKPPMNTSASGVKRSSGVLANIPETR